MNTAHLHIASGSEYGKRINTDRLVKERIAETVVKDILLRAGFDPRNPVFFSDGSSAAFVFWHFMRAYLAGPHKDLLNILTNNFDVPLQVLCEPGAAEKVSIQFAPGFLRAEYCGVYGSSTDEWIEKNCVNSTCVMAVTGLDAEFGPTAKHPDAITRKAAIMRAARQLVIVANASKLRNRQNIAISVSPNEWKRWCDDRSGRLHVVTDHTAGLPWPPGSFVLTPGANDKRTPDEIEQENHRLLRFRLGARYVPA